MKECLRKHEIEMCRKKGIGFHIDDDLLFYFIPKHKLVNQKILEQNMNHVICSVWHGEENVDIVVYPFPLEMGKNWHEKALQLEMLSSPMSKSDFNHILHSIEI